MARNLNISVSHRVLAAFLAGSACFAAPAFAADDQPIELGPVRVQDNGDKNIQNHDIGLSVMPTTVQDTPQSVNVISAETMKDQATTTLGDALRNVPGITIAIGEGGTLAGDQFKIRGFDAKDDVYLDGLRDFAAYTRDSFNYEEVQVLKGPSGLMFGRGTTGGAINTVSKTPFLDNKVSAHGEIGNGDHYRATADANYVIDDTAALRLNLMFTDTGVVDRDLTHSTRWGIAPSIGLGLGTDTSFILSYVHQHTSGRQDYGVVVATPPGSNIAEPATEFGVPRNTYMGFAADHDKNNADLVTARLNHKATDWLTFTNDTRLAVYSRDFRYTPTDRCDYTSATNFCSDVLFGVDNNGNPVDPTTALAGTGGGGPYIQNSWGIQNIAAANADFHVGGFRNQLIAGLDASYQRADRTIYAYTLPDPATYTYQLGAGTPARTNIGFPLFGFDHLTPPGYNVILPTSANVAGTSATPTTVVNSTGDATDLALFATDRFWFTEQWSLIAGVRVDQYKANYDTVLVNGTAASAKSPSNPVNPRASILFEPDETQTYYFSWSRSATPQGTSVVGSPNPISSANQALDPEKSENLEVGAKVNLFDGALGLSGSLFQVTKSNATTTDPQTGNLVVSGQRQRVRGLELSATGTITEAWSVLASYTYLDPVITSDLTTPYNIGRQITFVPKNAASLWTDYNFKAQLPGFKVGGGLVYQGPLYNGYTAPNSATYPLGRIVRIPETVELDAVASYEFARKYRVALNINNITDRLNYSQSFGNRGTPAAGRTFIVSLDAAL